MRKKLIYVVAICLILSGAVDTEDEDQVVLENRDVSNAGPVSGLSGSGMPASFLGMLGGQQSSGTSLLFSLLPTILPQLLKSMLISNKSSEACTADIDNFVADLMKGKLWALKMFDASGKLDSGILEGNVYFLGNYDECQAIVKDADATADKTVTGNTCVVRLVPPANFTASIGNPLQIPARSVHVPLVFTWHICIPTTCGNYSVHDALQNVLANLGLTVPSVMCSQPKSTIKDDSAAVSVVATIGILVSLVLLGSFLDLYLRALKDPLKEKTKDKPRDPASNGFETTTELNNVAATNDPTEGYMPSNGFIANQIDATQVESPSSRTNQKGPSAKRPLWQRTLLCFSAVTNGEKILSVKSTPGSLTCLNGIRVLSMGWVILGHVYQSSAFAVRNVAAFARQMHTVPFQVIWNGTLSVDSFFLLSGLLVTYLFLRETGKHGGVRVKQMIMYYVHRYLRLTPAYAAMLYFYICLLPSLIDAPAYTGHPDAENCRKHWWADLLYINNVYEKDKPCLGWSWYLANDMQFYVIAPAALIPFALGWRILGVLVSLGLLITSIVTTAYFDKEDNQNNLLFVGTGQNVYVAPWCRVGTFAIGVMLGFLLHKTNSKIKINPFLQCVGWPLALILAGACTLATYDMNAEGRPPWSADVMSIKDALYRPGWGLVLAWVILMCSTGHGGVINWVLSWNWWLPLSRLTYGVYLLHPLVVIHQGVQLRSLFFFNVEFVVHRLFSVACLSYISSFLLAILVEAPFLQLEKMILS